MIKVFKTFFVILGSILIGLGIGLIIPKSVQIQESYYWLIIIFTLILGGFFLGFGIVAQAPQKKEIEEVPEVSKEEKKEVSEKKVEENKI